VPVAGLDFAFTGYPLAYPSYALNLGRTYQVATWGGAPLPCDGCHGFPIRTQAPSVVAMVGQSHSWLDAQGAESGHGRNHGFAPLPCSTCHVQTVSQQNATSRTASGVSVYGPVPVAGFAFHVNGLPDVVFDTARSSAYLTPKSLAGATYAQATSTCSNVACHLDQTAVKHGTPFRSDTVTPECNVCHHY
jgi:predicted CxxxxCH...CXXCH cytochrome family protein